MICYRYEHRLTVRTSTCLVATTLRHCNDVQLLPAVSRARSTEISTAESHPCRQRAIILHIPYSETSLARSSSLYYHFSRSTISAQVATRYTRLCAPRRKKTNHVLYNESLARMCYFHPASRFNEMPALMRKFSLCERGCTSQKR